MPEFKIIFEDNKIHGFQVREFFKNIMKDFKTESGLLQKETTRNYGLDLLRCIAMIMIVILHILSGSGLLSKTTVGTAEYETVWFIEIFCFCAVNCFVILSGYVNLRCEFRLSRILLLWLQVAFYNLLLTVIMQAVNDSPDALCIRKALFPVSSNAYWFFTQYFVLSFFMPFINKLVTGMTLKQNGILVGIMLFFFSLLPTLYGSPVNIIGKLNENLFLTKRGYSVLWLTVMYFCGAYIKRLAEENKTAGIKKRTCLLMFLGSDIIIWVIHFFCVNSKNPVSDDFIISYASPFVVLSAVGMVLLFSKMQFNKAGQRLIAFFSSGAFAVYLIHIHSDIFPVFKRLVAPMLDMKLPLLIPTILLTALLVFVACSSIDMLRNKLVKLMRIDKLCKKADKKINDLLT